jgi:hypothetical protein
MIYHIYCDESRQTKERYMLLGGIIVNVENLEEVENSVQKYRDANTMFAEIKWTKVSRKFLPEYKCFVDIFFNLKAQGKLYFHSLIIDSHLMDHKKYSEGDSETSFYKF